MTPLIYIIDDEPGIRRYLEAALESCRCRAASFGGTQQALEAIARQRPELVLLDWLMPGLSRAAAVEALRLAGCKRIVVCTAMVLPDEVEGIRLARPDDLLTKPCTLEEIEAAVRKWFPESAPRG